MIPRPTSFCESCEQWSGKCGYRLRDGYGCDKQIDQVVWARDGAIIELRIGAKWYYSDFVENTHRSTADSKQSLGHGECGVVYLDGTEAVKATYARGRKTIEGEVYAAVGGLPGIANGRQDGNEIRTPVYENVVSKYTVRKAQRPLFGPLIAANRELIRSALRALSEAGYSYGDALQFGVDGEARLLLLDFSAATRRDDAAEENWGRLRELERDFEVKGC